MSSFKRMVRLGTILLATSTFVPAVAAAQAVVKADGSYEYPNAKYKNRAEHYEALKRAANGGVKMTWDKLPDWSGIWTRGGMAGLKFDPKQPAQNVTTAKLTPTYEAMYKKKVEEVKAGTEWDRLSYCLPPGHPRWLTEPFLREFILRPDQVWLVNEMVNDIRRIYTDGRGHTPADEAYPLWNGDSIGFWDGDTLVISTTQLREGQYQRAQPDYSDQVETIEKWRKVADDRIEAEVTVYDPPALMEPWTVTQIYTKVTEPADLRIRYWSCEENSNVQNEGGATKLLLPGDPGYRDPNKITERPPGE